MRRHAGFYFSGIPKDKQPLITVAICCYNVDKYLPRCIESVMKQTYSNLEILIVDDGSRDKTAYVCDYYATQDPRINVIHQSNAGPGIARSIAVSRSQGEYIAFLNGFDYVEPETYEYMLSAMLETGTRLGICGYYEDKVDDPALCHEMTEEMRAGRIMVLGRGELLEHLVEESEEITISEIMWNKLFHRDLLYDKSVSGTQSFDGPSFTLETLHKASSAAFIDTKFYHYIIDKKDSMYNWQDYSHIFNEWIPACDDAKRYLATIGREDLSYTMDYLICKRLLDYYDAVKTDKDKENRKYLSAIREELNKCGTSFGDIFGCRIADPDVKKRMRTFLDHPWVYDHFYSK